MEVKIDAAFWQVVWQNVISGSVVKSLSTNAGDVVLILGLGRSPGEGHGNPLQYSCLGKPLDRGAWQAILHGAARIGHDLVTKQQ